MKLDHVSYVATHDQISDVVNRIGSQLQTAFTDGGKHPRFGTRNFTAPLLDGSYIEVVCPMDHPATDATPFGKAVKQKALEGGGWFAWVVSVDDISSIETKLGRQSVAGQRVSPNGIEFNWKQIGVLGTIKEAQWPFFVQWEKPNHPSNLGLAKAKIQEIKFSGNDNPGEIKIDTKKFPVLTYGINPSENGIEEVVFALNGSTIAID